jgi:hypothetical protein
MTSAFFSVFFAAAALTAAIAVADADEIVRTGGGADSEVVVRTGGIGKAGKGKTTNEKYV